MDKNDKNEKYESILITIKKLLGISESCTDFDIDIITHINTALMVLNQIGVGTNNYMISSEEDVWTDFITEDDEKNLGAIKSYIHLKVRIIFDPPLNASILESMQQTIRELEWRLNVKAESTMEEV